GKRFRAEDFPESNWDVKRWLWEPALGCEGFFQLRWFRHVTVLAGAGVGGALFAWLRNAAPTSPTRAGWVIGIAAGAAGATIVALHCPSNDMVHIALWHGLAVVLAAVAGRLLLTPLLRW
ncbi:MAG: DUF1109 family protein, partial [Sphingopyxis sp.]|nr:DUF1109 family protein [Sphingopyxis sp.]